MSRICFICPDINSPAGGVKQLYRQVDVLNKNGYEAFIVHGHKHFKVNWFDNNTSLVWHPQVAQLEGVKSNGLKERVKHTLKKGMLFKSKFDKPILNKRLELKADDIVVLPEFYGKSLNDAFKAHNVVIYNQNCYYTFRGYGVLKASNVNSIYKQTRLKGVIVASEDAKLYMSSFIHEKPLYRVKYGIDSSVFKYQTKKKKQIAFMPRKLREDSEQVFNILKMKGVLNGWDVVAIEGLNEFEVAKILTESSIFLSFNHREGFGMPSVEAMSCGCIVVGYSGQGGKEYFLPDMTYEVPQRNIRLFTETLETVIHDFETQPEKMIKVGANASKFIGETYSMQQEESSIVNTWQNLLNNQS